MTAVDRQRQRDAGLIRSMVRDGMASPATYLPPGSTDPAIPCAVVVIRDVQQIGSEGQVIGNAIHVDFQFIEVTPRAGGVVNAEGEIFTLVAKATDDSSITRWAIRA